MEANTELESAIQTVMQYYSKYSDKKGISKDNFAKMVQKELCHRLTCTESKQAIDELIRQVDQNKDKVIERKEYLVLIKHIADPLARQMQSQK